jgi:hypothetical protein
LATPRLTLREITERLGGEVVGDEAITAASLDEAARELTFRQPESSRRDPRRRRVGPADRDATSLAHRLDNPYAYFARTLAIFHPPKAAVGVPVGDPAARVAVSAEIGPLR